MFTFAGIRLFLRTKDGVRITMVVRQTKKNQ